MIGRRGRVGGGGPLEYGQRKRQEVNEVPRSDHPTTCGVDCKRHACVLFHSSLLALLSATPLPGWDVTTDVRTVGLESGFRCTSKRSDVQT